MTSSPSPPSFIKESIFSRRKLRFSPVTNRFAKDKKKAWDTLMRFNNFSAVVVSLRFFAKCKLRERPGEFYKRIKAETVFCKRAYGNMKFQGVHGKRGAIQFRNSCIKDTKNLPFARVKKRERGRKGTGEREK